MGKKGDNDRMIGETDSALLPVWYGDCANRKGWLRTTKNADMQALRIPHSESAGHKPTLKKQETLRQV